MKLVTTIALYLGMAYQFFRPVNPMDYQPRYIKRYQVPLIRIWRVFKFLILYAIALFLLSVFGVDYN